MVFGDFSMRCMSRVCFGWHDRMSKKHAKTLGFGTISDSKWMSKSIKNPSKNCSKINLQISPISASSSIKFRRQSHVQAKWSISENRSKT